MTPFAEIWDRAVARHGEEALRARLPTPTPEAQLRALPDHRALAAMTKHVFAAGFRWKVIEAKWDGFEAAFHGFDVDPVAGLDIEGIEALAQDTRIVRNRPKIVATVNNAAFVQRIADEHGSFGAWLADWPKDDVVGLWDALKDGGDRLGGQTGPRTLRSLGYDTFLLGGDGTQALIEAGVIDKPPTGKRARRAAQDAILAWAAESGRTRAQVSVVLACSTGEVYAR